MPRSVDCKYYFFKKSLTLWQILKKNVQNIKVQAYLFHRVYIIYFLVVIGNQCEGARNIYETWPSRKPNIEDEKNCHYHFQTYIIQGQLHYANNISTRLQTVCYVSTFIHLFYDKHEYTMIFYNLLNSNFFYLPRNKRTPWTDFLSNVILKINHANGFFFFIQIYIAWLLFKMKNKDDYIFIILKKNQRKTKTFENNCNKTLLLNCILNFSECGLIDFNNRLVRMISW